MLAESSEKNYDFSTLKENIAQYYGKDYFMIVGIESIIFILLGLYVFYVFPHEIGNSSHPLFFLGFPYHKQK